VKVYDRFVQQSGCNLFFGPILVKHQSFTNIYDKFFWCSRFMYFEFISSSTCFCLYFEFFYAVCISASINYCYRGPPFAVVFMSHGFWFWLGILRVCLVCKDTCLDPSPLQYVSYVSGCEFFYVVGYINFWSSLYSCFILMESVFYLKSCKLNYCHRGPDSSHCGRLDVT
jgi:hypothetical protein